MVDLQALRVLAAVAAEGSLSAAARALGVTQQAVSARMRALEAQIGAVLLERGPRGSQPTATGLLVAGWAGEILDAGERFEASVRALKESRRHTLRVAASLTIAEYLLPGWLATSAAGSGPVRLDAENSDAVIEGVRRGAADLGFIETPDLPTDLPHRVFASDEVVVVVPPAHEWAARRDISAHELSATALVLRESGSGTRRALEAALQDAGAPPHVAPVAELPSTLAIRTTAMSGLAPTALSGIVVRDDLRAGRLVHVPVRGMRILRPLTAVWPPTGLTAAASALLEIVAADTRRRPLLPPQPGA